MELASNLSPFRTGVQLFCTKQLADGIQALPISTTKAWNEDTGGESEQGGMHTASPASPKNIKEGKKAEPLHYDVFHPDRKGSIFIYLPISPPALSPPPPPAQAKFLNQQILSSGAVKSYWGTDSDSITTIHGAIFCGESLSSTWLSPALHITSEWHALSLGKKWEFFFQELGFQ